MPPPTLAEVEGAFGVHTIPNVVDPSALREVRAVPHTDEEFIAALVGLERLGEQHKARPRFWKTLRLAATLLKQAEILARIAEEFALAVKRPGPERAEGSS